MSNLKAIIDRRRRLKKSFLERQKIFGTWTSFSEPQIAELFALTNCGFVGIDIEHGVTDLRTCQQIIAASQAGGSLCLPRIASHNPEMIKRLLDAGADGIIAPMVNTREQAEAISSWCKFAPMGQRSYGVNRAQTYGLDFEEYAQSWNETSVLIAQIESIEAVKNIDEILSVHGIDGVMVGPYDMSGSLGIPGQIDHPQIREATSEVLRKARECKKSCGTQIVPLASQLAASKFEEGYTFVVLSSDIFLMAEWVKDARQLIQKFQ